MLGENMVYIAGGFWWFIIVSIEFVVIKERGKLVAKYA